MTTDRQVSEAILGRIEPAVSALNPKNPLWFEPLVIPAPAVAVFPRDPGTDLAITGGNSTAARWFMTIGLYLPIPGGADEYGPRAEMGVLTGTTGPIMLALRSRTIKDDLFNLCGRAIHFGKVRGKKPVSRRGNWILPAYIDLDLNSRS